eukprot:scaffold9901_cov65-Phaeocystis_antarctica.AAC.3
MAHAYTTLLCIPHHTSLSRSCFAARRLALDLVRWIGRAARMNHGLDLKACAHANHLADIEVDAPTRRGSKVTPRWFGDVHLVQLALHEERLAQVVL